MEFERLIYYVTLYLFTLKTFSCEMIQSYKNCYSNQITKSQLNQRVSLLYLFG